jgi:hypothetical protein
MGKKIAGSSDGAKREKDNAETQRALRLAERREKELTQRAQREEHRGRREDRPIVNEF